MTIGRGWFQHKKPGSNLFDRQRLAVLATPETHTHRPYLRLMAFAATPALTILVMAALGRIAQL